MIRMKEKRREKAAAAFAVKNLGVPSDVPAKVKSSWGPYTSTVRTAKTTAVPGL